MQTLTPDPDGAGVGSRNLQTASPRWSSPPPLAMKMFTFSTHRRVRLIASTATFWLQQALLQLARKCSGWRRNTAGTASVIGEQSVTILAYDSIRLVPSGQVP